jgi:predicted flap endonuclease-1-like 5' DNA nuclease
MSLLFRIVYAIHANGTHHKLALDALRHLTCARGERWQRLMLCHHELYLQGSKAPDNKFKDFKNHVLHVHDGYWGGAPDKAQSWYAKLLEALRRGIWPDAAYIAGVLSHYYTDPIQPFHTAQSEAENNIHRAVEWSIAKSYDELMRLAEGSGAEPEIPPADDPDWLRELVCRGAETSNRYYEKLIAHYDFNRGVVDPPAGLDAQSRLLLAELLDYAARGFAAILDRAFAEAAVEPPEVDLRAETVLAGLNVPLKWVTNRIADAQERRLVERMYDELTATGRVEENLPEDDRVVRDLYREEVLAPRELRQRWRRSMVASKPSAAPTPAPVRAAPAASREPAAPPMRAEPAAVVRPIAATPAAKGNTAARKTYLALSDNVERAPAIGAKTAARLASAGIKTVADLLSSDPGALAARLDVGHISAAVVRDWQDQARLMMAVPRLRGTHSQLIVGAGYRTAQALAAAESSALLAAILRFVGTREGQRILRDGSPPDLEKILAWIASAAEARAA